MLLARYLLFFVSGYFAVATDEDRGPPHIIFILADDLGWNDVSFHGSAQIPTPNIDALAAAGIILNGHYTAPQCTPSRASLMTGRFPTNTGLQHYVISAGTPNGLPLNFTIMPQHFKRLGYATHLVGKWHLGYYKKKYTPEHRGFDSFFGFWNGVIDQFDHTNRESRTSWGVDLHNNSEPVMDLRGRYLPDIFTEKAQQVIENHNPSEPLFLMLSQAAPHTGNTYQRLQTTPENMARFPHIKDVKRRFYAGAVSALDNCVEKVFVSLDKKDMLDNCIVIFVSDNGAESGGHRGGHGSNWPLRGSKMHLWEGAVRTPAAIWSPLLGLSEPRTSMQRMHISDWLPTLYTAAGGKVEDLEELDGVNLWQHWKKNVPYPKREILLTVDPIFGMSALIQGDYKLVNGTFKDYRDSWYGPFGEQNLRIFSMDDWVWKDGSVVVDILSKRGRWLLKSRDTWRRNATVDCGPLASCPSSVVLCDPMVYPCLFNIAEDPCEYFNLAPKLPEVVKSMMQRIQELNSTSLEPLVDEEDPKADPRCHGFAYVSWYEDEHQTECFGV